MGFFNRGNGCDCTSRQNNDSNNSAVKILGGGCEKCNQLEANTIEALKLLGMDTGVDHVRDYKDIASYGVISTPALVYNNKVLCYGRVLTAQEIVELLKRAM